MALVAIISAQPVRADSYTCKLIDVPGSSWTQLWRLNDRGQVAAASSLGAYVYGGKQRWQKLPDPPAATGFTADNMAALDVSNNGEIVGVAINPATPTLGQGFTLGSISDPSSYAFYSYNDPNAPQDSYVEFRGVNDNGLVLGWSYDATGNFATGYPFVLNPTSAAQGIFQPGFTPFQPKLSDGSASIRNIPGGINNAGQFVLSGTSDSIVREGLLYDAQTLTTFTFDLPGQRTSLRGVNDRDPNSAANCAGSRCVRVVGWGRTIGSQTYQSFYVDYDSATGWQTPQFIDCGGKLPAGSQGLILQGVSNKNVVTGTYDDAAGNPHGLIAYPNRVLPAQVVGSSFVFSVKVAANVSVFLDPSLAVGYRYSANRSDPAFASVTLPLGVGDDAFTLLVGGKAWPLSAEETFDFAAHGFGNGVRSFEVLGIEPGAALAADDPEAFITEVTFAADGTFTGSMTPLSAGDEMAQLAHFVDEARVPDRLEDEAEQAGGALKAGNTAAACSSLARLAQDATALSATRPEPAGTIAQQAQAVANALACP
jgi:hypothetical protein